MALAIGNVLNGDTPKGQADGFDMSVLDKLVSIKDNSGQSLMAFIVKKIIKENEEFPAKIKELITMFSTRKTDISITKSKAGELLGMLSDATDAQNTLKNFSEPNDRF